MSREVPSFLGRILNTFRIPKNVAKNRSALMREICSKKKKERKKYSRFFEVDRYGKKRKSKFDSKENDKSLIE